MKNRPHVLVILMYWYPYEGALQPIYGPVFEELMKKGMRFTILCSFPHFRLGREERWEKYRGMVLEMSEWKGARVIRSFVFAPVFKSPRMGKFMRALNFISFSLSSLFASFLAEKPDLIFAPSSPPLLNGLSAFIIGKLKRCPFIYNIQDLYPDIALQTGMTGNRTLLSLLSRMETFIYSKAETISVISPGMKNNLLRKRVSPKKITIIPNFIDPEFIKPSPKRNPFSIKHDLCDAFVVLFAGNMGFSHGLEQLLEAAKLLRNKEDILFLFVGRGENRDFLMELTREWELPNVCFLPLQPFSQMNNVWAASDLSVVCLKPGVAPEAIFPSKTFGIMAGGRPVLAIVKGSSDLADMMRESGCGVVAKPGDPRAIADAVLSMEANRNKIKEMGEKGRVFVENGYSLKKIADLYERLFLCCSLNQNV